MSWSDIQGLVRRGLHFWNVDMWRADYLSGYPRYVSRPLLGILKSLYIVVDAFRQERIRLRAATLTFVTLLSLVPLLAVAFSLFTAFGGLREVGDQLKALVVDALAVQQREIVTEYLDRFIGGANAGGLGAVGSATLFVTAVSTLSNIETSFNDIWGVREARGWVTRFQVYLPIVTLGPVLIGLGFSSVVAVEGSETVRSIIQAAPVLATVFRLGPILLYATVFSFLYLFLPNTKVRVAPAVIGGFIAAFMWVVAQRLFTVYAGRAISYSAIYGSFGAVPLTILWVYISWTLVLLGSTISFSIQSLKTFEPEREVSTREREHVAARLALEVVRTYEKGLGPMLDQQLIDRAAVPPRLGRLILERLVETGILLKTILPNEEAGLVPSKPGLTLADIVEALRGAAPSSPWPGRETMMRASQAEDQILRENQLGAYETVDLGEVRLEVES